MGGDNFLTVCGEADASLSAEIAAEVQTQCSSAQFSVRDIEYVAKLERPIYRDVARLQDADLEALRHLCGLWDLELKPGAIRSHRPLVGPLIVAVKRILLPILKVLLKDLIRQQREFNAAAIGLLAALAKRQSMDV